MKIASIQLNIVWENLQENLKLAKLYTQKAHQNGCDVIVFPEMFNSGFSMNIAKTAEKQRGETFQVLSELANEYSIYIIAGITEICTDNGSQKAENVALIFNKKGKLISRYVKNYSFNLAQEGDYFTQSNQQNIFNIAGVASSVFICYDLRFPEVFRKIANQVNVIFIIANWPAKRHSHWEALIKARAIENQCFVVAVNRTGTDGNELNYLGGSQVINPMGEILSCGKSNQELVITKIETELVKKIRTNMPFINDMKKL